MNDYFNPRSPHGERRCMQTVLWRLTLFQPTLPARGATLSRRALSIARLISTHAPRTGSDGYPFTIITGARDFNPRSPHGERPQGACKCCNRISISTHAPRTGSDVDFAIHANLFNYFNPRSPHGERRRVPDERRTYCSISTHAPRTGSDYVGDGCGKKSNDFNPRSPHGERPRK